jgi:hypothetical protein
MENKNKIVGHCDDGYPLDKDGNIVGEELPPPTICELIEMYIGSVNLTEQMTRQLIMKVDLSELLILVGEKAELEFQEMRQHFISEEGLDEDDMDDDSTEDYVNGEARELFEAEYGIPYDLLV